MATTKKKASTEKITLVPLTDLYERADHPIKMRDDSSMLETMPVIIRELDDEQAIIEMVDSGIQREEVLPSEKAAAYKMKLEAIKRQGARTDLTSRQDGGKSENGEKKEAADIVNELKEKQSFELHPIC